MSSAPVIAVIIDISHSRELPDRAAAQQHLDAAFHELNEIVPAAQAVESTIGDEFQAVYADRNSALRATLYSRLLLPDGLDCRFGLGRGDLVEIGRSIAGRIQDGSAWWAAREAINEAHARQYGKQPFVRTWYRDDATSAALVNAFLLCRDQLLDGMNARTRRLLLGSLRGATQGELAAQEGISQSAVSQTLLRSGARALLASEELLTEVTT